MSTYNDKSCDPFEEGGYTGEEIPPIDQKTIECNLTRFVAWLDRLVDQVNYLSCLYLDLKTVVLENRQRIECLEERVDTLESDVSGLKTRVTNLETRMGTAETRINNILGDIDTINNQITTINSNIIALDNRVSAVETSLTTTIGRVDKLYSYLPASTSTIDARSWKFGMGNINVMSANSGTPAITGPGIFTSDAIENNDLYFN